MHATGAVIRTVHDTSKYAFATPNTLAPPTLSLPLTFPVSTETVNRSGAPCSVWWHGSKVPVVNDNAPSVPTVAQTLSVDDTARERNDNCGVVARKRVEAPGQRELHATGITTELLDRLAAVQDPFDEASIIDAFGMERNRRQRARGLDNSPISNFCDIVFDDTP